MRGVWIISDSVFVCIVICDKYEKRCVYAIPTEIISFYILKMNKGIPFSKWQRGKIIGQWERRKNNDSDEKMQILNNTFLMAIITVIIINHIDEERKKKEEEDEGMMNNVIINHVSH